MLCKGEQFKAGYLIAPTKWYMLQPVSERGYSLRAEKPHKEFNHMVRLKDLEFNQTQARPHHTNVSSLHNSPTGKLSFISEDMQQHFTCMCLMKQHYQSHGHLMKISYETVESSQQF